MRTLSRRSRAPGKRFGPGRSSFLKKRNLPDRNASNIWYHYSGRLRRDVLIAGDPHFEHFCWLEGEESISEYELRPAAVAYTDGQQPEEAQCWARVIRRSGRPELHAICDEDCAVGARLLEAVSAAGFEYIRISPSFLSERTRLIRNWRRALAFLGAARELPLDPACNEIASFFRTTRQSTLGQVLERTKIELRSLYTAAVFRCLQDGWLNSDLATKPLCLATHLSVPEPCHDA